MQYLAGVTYKYYYFRDRVRGGGAPYPQYLAGVTYKYYYFRDRVRGGGAPYPQYLAGVRRQLRVRGQQLRAARQVQDDQGHGRMYVPRFLVSCQKIQHHTRLYTTYRPPPPTHTQQMHI